MPDPCVYDYAIVRVLPNVERGEFVNAGVIVSCTSRRFLKARIGLDGSRALALDPSLDIEAIDTALSAMGTICDGGKESGPIGQLSARERFDWLVAPRSSSIQTSVVHSGCCEGELDGVLDWLFETMVSAPGKTSRP